MTNTTPPVQTHYVTLSDVTETPHNSTTLDQLEAKRVACLGPHNRPDRLALSMIKQRPDLFQPREGRLDERHLQELKRAIQSKGTLDPIEVILVGDEAYLIDGHHRCEAYRMAKVTEAIPVRYFGGTVHEAVLESGKSNSKAKLPMTTPDRQNYAWRLVRLGTFTKAAISEASSVSDGQVANMRRIRKKLGKDADNFPRWWQAREHANGKNRTDMSEDEREQWLDDQAFKFTDRLGKTFGNKLSANLEVTARAFDAYFGRRLPELCRQLEGFVPECDDDDDCDF